MAFWILGGLLIGVNSLGKSALTLTLNPRAASSTSLAFELWVVALFEVRG